MTRRPQLGEWCVLRAQTVKVHITMNQGFGKRWDSNQTRWSRVAFPKLLIGCYMGFRRVAEGHTEMDGDPDIDGAQVFTPTNYLEVWIFVYHERKKPIFVLPEDVMRGDNEASP